MAVRKKKMIEQKDKKEIIKKICYTELVYGRINKKLETDYSKIGKNYYAENANKGIRLTINSYTYRIITVDRLK